jgi:hypothetical protein
MNCIKIITLLVACSVLSAQEDRILSDVILNSSAESYALTFRNGDGSSEGVMEAWLTIAPQAGTDKRVLARSVCSSRGFGSAVPLTDEALNAPNTTYNGVPTFNPCDRNEAVIVSDRQSDAESRRSNDLYLVRYNGQQWSAERLSVNSPSWDDTPCFGLDGSMLYFASDRRRPGGGAADIYMTRRKGTEWSEPVLLDRICSANDHEASPFVGADGRLYYTTNRNGDQDIWSVDLGPDGLPIGESVRTSLAGVNMKGSDEYHPIITPGGSWLVFSSNRREGGGTGPFKLYYRRIQNEPVDLTLHVTARTKIRDAKKVQYFGRLDSIHAVQTRIMITTLNDGQSRTLETNAQGVATLRFDPADVEGPYADAGIRTFVAKAYEHARGYAAGVDTLIIDLEHCTGKLDHTLYLDDTASKDKQCQFTFRTFNVPFFVTAYWCPTTVKYRSYTPCTSLFTNDVECEQLEQPEHCETNEAYTYTFVPARIIREDRRAENCVNYPEFRSNGDAWAELVDVNIERMRDEVGAALHEPCVQEAIRRGLDVTVTYIGTTDDRSISAKCAYTGRGIDEIRQAMTDIEITPEIEPFIKTGQRFNAGGYGGKAGGNQLLSDLRSLFFAILFDNLCKETIPVYRELRSSQRLKVRSRGQAIDERDLPFEFKRAAGVEVRVPDFEVLARDANKVPTRTIRLCSHTPCRH